MKQIARITILMAAVLSLTACKPEPIEIERDITYTVSNGPLASSRQNTDNMTVTVHLTTDAEFDALLEQFCDWVQNGSTVTFHGASMSLRHLQAGSRRTKEATTFSTTSREEMKRWMAQMEDSGMTVTVTYDPNTGIWNGVAYATAPQPPVGNGVATYVSPVFDGWGNGLNVIVTIDSLNRTAYVNFDYNNYWLHMPCGVFHNIYEENGRLILAVWENLNGTDTLYIGRNYEDSLMICYDYSGACTADHTHGCYLVPAPMGLETWYSDQVGGIIMNVMPNAIETYPEIHLAQFCAFMGEDINCICPIITGFCEMQRYYTDRTGINWELSLRYTYNNDSSYFVVDSLGLSGHEIGSDTYDMAPVVIHDLHQYPGCASQYVFQRIN